MKRSTRTPDPTPTPTPASRTKRPTQPSRLQALEAENALLRERLERLEQRVSPAGVGGLEPKTIRVGGEAVRLRPLPPVEFVRAEAELPMFVVALAAASSASQVAGKLAERVELTAADYDRAYARAKEWIKVCAVGEVDLEALTVPEAQHALVVICNMNGLTERLALFFRQFGPGAPDGHRPSLQNLRS